MHVNVNLNYYSKTNLEWIMKKKLEYSTRLFRLIK